MKKIILTTAILLIACSFCSAQKTVKIENIDVNAQTAVDSLQRNVLYLFPEFIQGKVFFKNGATSTAKLNYNTLIGEMQFLDKENNILAIANPQDVAYVLIDKKVFYYVSGKRFAQLLVNNDDIKLCVSRHSEYYETKAQGAYGQSLATAAISEMKYLLDKKNINVNQLAVYRDVTYTIKDEFLLEKDGKFTKVNNVKSFIKIFPKYKEDISKYVATHKTNFKNEQDLIKLTNYCIQLSLVKK
ncbi:MAG: hypothetical protein LBQ28_04880 [Prevotellaceae bacterium]|jgi:hypothetical protein|nr:hypothetical protein [Prevotellaceae bacterium]